MNWNMAPEDFQFTVSLEPEGCFVAFEGSERLGIATCISFGSVGWFGNLIVKPDHRRRGVGRELVKHALHYLQNKGVKTVGLYAYQNLVSFYNGLGFKQDEDFSVLHTEHLGVLPDKSLLSVGKNQLPLVEAFDRTFFGGDRKKLLESHHS